MMVTLSLNILFINGKKDYYLLWIHLNNIMLFDDILTA